MMFQLYQDPRAATITYPLATDPYKKHPCVVLGVLIEEGTLNPLYLISEDEADSTKNAPWWSDASSVKMYIGAHR